MEVCWWFRAGLRFTHKLLDGSFVWIQLLLSIVPGWENNDSANVFRERKDSLHHFDCWKGELLQWPHKERILLNYHWVKVRVPQHRTERKHPQTALSYFLLCSASWMQALSFIPQSTLIECINLIIPHSRWMAKKQCRVSRRWHRSTFLSKKCLPMTSQLPQRRSQIHPT